MTETKTKACPAMSLEESRNPAVLAMIAAMTPAGQMPSIPLLPNYVPASCTSQLLSRIDSGEFKSFDTTEQDIKAFRDYVVEHMPAMDALADGEFQKHVISGTVSLCVNNSVAFSNMTVKQAMDLVIHKVHQCFFGLQAHKTAWFLGGPRYSLVSLGSLIVDQVPEDVGEHEAVLRGVVSLLVERAIREGRLKIIGTYTPRGVVDHGRFVSDKLDTYMECQRQSALFTGNVSDRVRSIMRGLFPAPRGAPLGKPRTTGPKRATELRPKTIKRQPKNKFTTADAKPSQKNDGPSGPVV